MRGTIEGRGGRSGRRRAVWAALIGIVLALEPLAGRADTISLRNGMQVQGRVGKIASINENPLAKQPDPDAPTPVVFVDDSLRRTYFPARQIRPDGFAVGNPPQERIRIDKRIAVSNKRIGVVGPVLRITPFDEFGNRSYTMNTGQGPLTVIQGITEVSPVSTKVEGLLTEQAYVWDMRIATSSIPRTTLSKVLRRQIDVTNPDQRLQIVRLYTQAERFEDARQELAEILADFPELSEFKKQEQELLQLTAGRLLREVELRRSSGQHRLAVEMLQNFPAEGLADETSIRVRELLQEYDEQYKLGQQVVKLIEALQAKLPDDAARRRLETPLAELRRELNFHTLPRMADFLRLADDEKMTAEQRLALAVSGWVLGNGAGTDNLTVALETIEVRDLALQYLRSKQAAEREEVLGRLTSVGGATPANLAKILANMKPPIDPPQTDENSDDPPGYYEISVPGTAEQAEFVYHVQLPPEYDAYRKYPCVVTLGGAGLKAKDQLAWWTGVFDPRLRQHLGQAPRHGFIVVAVEWVAEHQRRYEYSAREHAAVLYSLRDACRRFSVDTDKVFLSGHSAGGDAAWDIGLSHPDLWAGLIPIVAVADKYVGRYSDNARYVPTYFVTGELDGDKMRLNGPQFDRYLSRVGYDVMITEYQGRGHEHFQEELPRIVEWMNVHRRDFFPKEWTVTSMRSWDNFFWFAELREFPRRAMVPPASWPPARGSTPASISGKLLENNGLHLDSSGAKGTIWLSPEMVDFSRRIIIKGRSTQVAPSIGTLLEDVRTRGDRQHPFWASVEL